MDLRTGKSVRHFQCDHFFLEFDWGAKGICYLDAVQGERRNLAKLMLHDPVTRKSSLIATGPFSQPRWMGGTKILVCKGNLELWEYRIDNLQGARLYQPHHEGFLQE